MRTFYVKRMADAANAPAMGLADSVEKAVAVARRLAPQLGDMAIRDALGGLRAEVRERDGKISVVTTR